MERLHEDSSVTSLSEDRLRKLVRITGRKNSLEVLDQYLSPASLDDALKNRLQIEKSDKMKKVFGSRPPNDVAKVTKVKNMTGRRMSVDAIQGLLTAETADQAVLNGKLLEKSDKLMHLLGQRPPIRLLISSTTPSPATSGTPTPMTSPTAASTAAALETISLTS